MFLSHPLEVLYIHNQIYKLQVIQITHKKGAETKDRELSEAEVVEVRPP